MYTRSQLEAFAGKTSTCKEVFASITTSRSWAAKSNAKTAFETFAKEALEERKIQIPVVAPIAALGEMFSLEEFLSMLVQEASQQPRSAWIGLFSQWSWVQSLALRVVAFTYGLDFSQLSLMVKRGDADWFEEVLHGIVLAGMYLSLPNKFFYESEIS